MNRRVRAALVFAVAAVATAPGWAAGLADARIDPPEITRGAGDVRVSWRLDDAFPEEVLERLQSGIPVTYRHRVELVSKRWMPLVPDKVLSRVTVETTAEYDSLTRRYRLERVEEVEVRGREVDAAGALPAERVTEDPDEVRAFMTEIDAVALPLPPGLREGPKRWIRVSASLGRRFVLGIFPSSWSVSRETPLAP